jgi:hypothetical protein
VPTPMSPARAVALELLADGEWHDREQLLDQMARAVPPGKAFRVGERRRTATRRRPNGPGPRVRGDDTTSIAAGAREVARKALFALARTAKIARDGDQYRLVDS